MRTSSLRILKGPDAGREISIPPVGVVIGADPANDVTLTDEAVSGRHCTIVPTQNGFKVQDLGSKNGTFLDDLALTEAVVPVGGVLRIGRTLIQLMPGEEIIDIPPSDRDGFGELRGTSLAMRKVYGLLERAAGSNAPILFLGESGTGKELAARAIHENSPRKNGPFVIFDCGAASETLIASDLFGHAKGAFTGADQSRNGAFADAHGGTLFLDEIGDLPLDLQPKLLRMLERGEVTALGTNKTKVFDVRIVAATHRNLWDEVCTGAFRGDLYYRLAVVEVHLPPLRAHKDDIAELVAGFLSAHNRAAKYKPLDIKGPNLDLLTSYHWPGNVRELRNVIQRALALSPENAGFQDMPILLRSAPGLNESETTVTADRPFREAKAEVVERFEKAYLQDLLRRSGENLSNAARIANLERKYLYTLLDKHGLRK